MLNKYMKNMTIYHCKCDKLPLSDAENGHKCFWHDWISLYTGGSGIGLSVFSFTTG